MRLFQQWRNRSVASSLILSLVFSTITLLSITQTGQPALASTPATDQFLTLSDTADSSAEHFDGLTSGTGTHPLGDVGVIPATGSFTIETWVYPESLNNGTSFHQVFQQTGGTKSNFGRFGLNLKTATGSSSDGYAGVQVIYDGINLNGLVDFPAVRVHEDRWTHIAVSVAYSNSGDSEIQLYLDGVYAARKSGPTNNKSIRTQNFTVGYFPFTGDDRHFHGGIDQIKVWNGVLSETQIRQSMHTFSTSGVASAPALRAHLPMNGSYADSTGNFNFSTVGTVSRSEVVKEAVENNKNILVFPRTYLTSTGGWTPPASLTSVDALVVAGGGGGGAFLAGGGGAGGFLQGTFQVTAGTPVAIKVGQGGVGAKNRFANGGPTQIFQVNTNGQDSSFGPNTAVGGGAGGFYYFGGEPPVESVKPAADGGSGGGGNTANSTIPVGQGGLALDSSQGSNGGAGQATTNFPLPSGGGGGAGGQGQDAVDSTSAGDGGVGSASSLISTTLATSWGVGEVSGGQVYFAGGGAGSMRGTVNTTTSFIAATGGLGGGGDGTVINTQVDPPLTAADSGLPNTGGGGGGAANSAGNLTIGGNGGSGVVILNFYKIVSYDANGATSGSAPADQVATIDSTVSLAGQSGLERRGYIFAGWNTQADGSGTTFQAGAGYSSGANLSLFAKWDPLPNLFAEFTSRDPGATNQRTETFRAGQSIIPASSSRTIEAWFFEKPGHTKQNPILGQGSNFSTTLTIMVAPSNSQRVLTIFETASGAPLQLTQAPIQAGVWNHFAYVLEGADYSVYVNGVLAGSGSWPSSPNLFGEFMVGENPYYANGKHTFNGFIDQVKIWNVALDASQVSASMHARADSGIQGLVHHFSFDDASNPGNNEVSAVDLTSNGPDSGWESIVYSTLSATLSFDVKGGSAIADRTFHNFDLVTDPGNPTRSNYDFVGWSTVDGDPSKIVTFPYAPLPLTSSQLIAIWEATLSISTPSSGLSVLSGDPYSLGITATGGSGSKVFSATGLPTGLSISASTGEISGIPVSPGSFTVSVTVTDADSNTATTNEFVIAVLGVLSNVGAPTVTATSGVLKSIEVSWTAVQDADSYALKIFDADGTTLRATFAIAGNATSFQINASNFPGIANGTEYKISLQAVGTGNFVTSDESAQVSVTTLESFTITYNGNNQGSGSAPSAQTKIQGVDLTLAGNPGNLLRDGYTFLGWNTQADGSGTSYSLSATYSPDSSAVLFAHWSASSHAITWDANGGNLNGGEAASFLTGQSIARPADPSKSGAVFVGWSTTDTSDQGEIQNKIYQWPYATSATSSITLHAIWLPACSVFKRSLVMGGTYFTFFERVGFSRQADCATVIPEQVDSVDVLVIGGGGGGGNNLAGGGGGGGVIFKTGIDVTADRVMAQSEGAGGAGGQNVNGSSRNGQTGGTSFAALSGSILTADGGSGGLTYWQNLTCSGGGATNAGSRAAGGAVSTASSNPSTGGPGKLGGGSSTFAGGAPTLGEYWYNTNFSSRFPWSAASGGGGGGAWKSFPNQNMTGGLGGGGQGGWDGPNNGGRDAFVPGSGGGGGGTGCGSGGRGADGAVQIRYESIRFSLTFSPGATGSGSDQSQTKIELVNTALPNASTAQSWFSRVGHDIVGWTTTDGGAQTHALGATLTSDADFTFYPVWQPKTYTITFSAGVNGTGSDFSITKSHGVDITLPDAATAHGAFTRTGFEVSGWSTTSAGAAKDFNLGATFSGNEDTTLYPFWRELAIEAIEDTWVQSGRFNTQNFGTSPALLLKNAGNSTSNNSNRVTYLKFKYDPAFTWSGAALEVFVAGNNAGSGSSAFGTSYTSFNVEIFAASNTSWDETTLTFSDADASNQAWGLDTSSWPWGINNGSYLGTLAIPADPNTVGQKFSLSTPELDAFLNADSDGEVTLFLTRTDLDGQANLSFASSEHPDMAGPTILSAGPGYGYRVSYDINGGTGQLPTSGVYTEGGAAYTIATTSGIIPPANSSIVGWNTERDGTGTDFASGDSYASTKSMTLYAIYELNPEVTFFSNYSGGPASVSQFVTPSTNTVLRKNTFTRTGYTFTGWATQANGSGTTYADQANINTAIDRDLFAQWSANTYTVLYDYRGADGGDTDVSDSFVVDSGNHITLPVPTKTGHNFDGWFESSSFAGNALGATYSPTQNITLTAKWDAIEYRIYYNTTNGTGTAPTDPNTYNYSQSAVVLANTSLSRLGYRFGGWTVNSDGSGTALNAGQTITFTSPSDIQLYPKWIANNYSISYNLNGGSGSLAGAPTGYSPATGAVTLPSTGFTKPGYDFDGWAITQNGQAVPYANFTTFTNITLYAVWDLKDISYTFDKGAATGQTIAGWPADSSALFASTFSLPTIPNTPVSIGGQPHIFSGWSDGSNTYQGGSSYLMGATSPTFTALWSEVYDVSYVFGGGSLAGETDADTECVTSGLCTDGQQITLHLAPSRTGYQFAGWKVQDTATIKAAGASHIVSSSAYIFYAQWTAIDYVMGFDSNFGSNNIASSTKNIGQQLVMPNPGTRTGYTFTGWTPDGGVTLLGIGAGYTVGSSSETFVAQWTPNTYTVTYDWQGGQAVGSPKVSDDYTVDTGNLPLPTGSSYTRDGFEFEGWALSTVSPTLLTNFQPTADVVLYAIWRDGNFTISYDGKGAQSGGGSGTVGRGLSATLPTPIRAGFVFLGWYTHPTAGVKVGDGGQAFSPDRSQTVYARWVQRSLFGVDEADLETAATLTVGSGGTGGSFTKNTSGKPNATVTIPNGALPDGTVVSARYFRSLDRQAALIQDDNALIFSLLVSWINGDGDSATVPDTDPNIPITVTFNSDAIRIGQMIYKVIGDQVTELGRATANGTITVELYEDPEIVLAATAPSLPTGITAIPGPSSSVVSWTAPQSDGGSPITGYIVTANPGGESCTTTLTSCTITNLVNGTNYTFEVVALNAIGGSPTSSPSAAIAPALRTFTATFDSNGGSAVAAVSFIESTVISAPASPTRAGFTFDGWSTFQNDVSTKVNFPYQSSDLNLTFYALWVAVPSPPSQESIRPETFPIPQLPVGDGPPSKIGFTPTKPSTSVWSTGANAQVRGVPGQVDVVRQGGESLVASGNGWTISLQAKNRAGKTLRAISPTGLQSQVAGSVQIVATGLRPNSFVEVWSAENLKYIGTLSVGADGRVDQALTLPKRLLIGEHTLQLGALDGFSRLITLSSPLRINGKVTVGTFKGNITIYTTQLEGQKLSAKVAGKWIVQDPIAKFKHHGFSRLIRYTGAGYRINVHVYVNGEFLRTQSTLTR